MSALLTGRFRLGANFWAREAGPRMWSRWDEGAVQRELVQARAIGLDLLRIFAFIPDFVRGVPGAYIVDAEMLARMRTMAQRAGELGLALLPSPLVGHMSGENFDLPGSGARDLFADPQLVAGAALLVEAVARTLAKEPAVVGYALSNEAPLWGRMHAGAHMDPTAIDAWVERITTACRAAHPGVPVGLGDGLMSGFPNDVVRTHVDFVGPHVYMGDADPIRQGYRYDHALALAARSGKPVLFEEFGGSATQQSEVAQAAQWNEAIYAAFTLGARGALGWCWSDFPVETVGREVPYEHHAFELGFGVTRADGSEKPVCDTLRAWRSFLEELPDAPPTPSRSDVVLVRPSSLERDHPFSWQDRGLCERAELSAYVLATQAGLAPRIVDEDALDPSAHVLLLPSVQRLLTSTWLAIEAQVSAGATLYWSWFGGDHAFHQGAWCPIFERLTGCRHLLRYGCFDLPPDQLELDDALDSVVLPTGAAHVRHGDTGSAPATSYLPIDPITARVLSRDQDGHAILVEHRLGRGRVVFCAAPLERYAARLTDGSTRLLAKLYARFGDGIVVDERLCVRKLSVGSRSLLAVMNRSHEPVRCTIAQEGALFSHAPLGGIAPDQLGPKQVLILPVAPSA